MCWLMQRQGELRHCLKQCCTQCERRLGGGGRLWQTEC